MNRNIFITPTQSCRSLNHLPTFTRSSTFAFLNYRRKVHNRLAVINNNVSDMIKESCSNIDQICNRVRECLHDMDCLERQRNIMILETLPEYEFEEVKSVEEITQEQDDVTDVSVIENLNDEDDTNFDVNKEVEEKKPNDIVSITPFFSVIKKGINDDLELNESYQKQFLLINKMPRPHSSDSTRNNVEKEDSILEMFKQNITDTSEIDDFCLMNKLVDNINEEIINFSQTTLNMTENFEKSESKPRTPNVKTVKRKSIKRLPKSKSKQKGVQVDDTLSENELSLIMTNNPQSQSFIIPDVYHKRATTDLYQKLVAQVEANDSFIFFQKLMNRRNKQKNEKNTGKLQNSKTKLVLDVPMVQYSYPKRSGSATSSNNSSRILSLKEKYADSLWFSQKHTIKQKKETKKRKGGSRTTSERSFRTKTQSLLSNKIEDQMSMRSISNKNTKGDKHTPKRKSVSCLPGSKNNLKVKPNSLLSLKSYKCHTDCSCKMIVKNNEPPSPISKCRLHWMKAKVDQRCHRKLEFLDILDDLTTRDLLPLCSEYPRKDTQPIKQEENKNVQDTYLYKLMYGKQNTHNAWKQLLEPSVTCSEKNCTQCESRTDPNSNIKKKNEKNDDNKENVKRKYSKNEVVKTLMPYMHDPNPKFCHSVTVMPVHVCYNKHKPTEASTNFSKNVPSMPKKLPLLPMKEAKGCKRAEWVPAGPSKPMKVVYDSLSKKLDTTSTKPLANSARLHEERILMKKITSKSYSPKGFGTFCQKPARSANSAAEAENKLVKFSNIQSDLKKINEQFQKRNLTNCERKMWANKYGKSVGQQLVSYIDKQEPQRLSPVPRYAKPQFTNQPSPTDSRKSPNSMGGSRNPQRQVLTHLQNLKQKNSLIQNNIQKAINVIEAKMVDILSAPADSTSIEAFDVMEKEITNVLSMMKCNNKRTPKSRNRENIDTKTDSSLEEDVNNISDELFKKLQKILDSEKSTSHSETDSSKITPTKEDKRNQKPTNSIMKENESKLLSSSITTTSLEENVIITSCSPHKKVTKIKENSIKTKSLQLSTVMPSSSLADEVSKGNWDKVTLLHSGDHPSIEKNTNENLLDSKVNESTIKLLLDQDKTMSNADDDFIPNSEGDIAKPQNILNISENLIYNVKVDVKNDDMNFLEKLAICETNEDSDLSKSEENIKTSKSIEVASEESLSVESNKENKASLAGTEETCNIMQVEAEASKCDDCSTEFNKSLDCSVEENQICPYNETSKANAPKVIEMEREDSSASFSEHVNRIIKRVENIYTQLDDIQSTESNDNIPRFKDAVDTTNVKSEIFLTPFMQAVKEKRKSIEPAKKSIIEKSPSYFNVITFLDTLNDIQEEKTVEIQIARLCYINVYHQPIVFHQAEVLHLAEFMPSLVERPSCLKKISDSKNKNKKVSFLVSKSDKSDQVNFCPIHKIKSKKTSSEQFPPLEPIQLESTNDSENDKSLDKSVGIETQQISDTDFNKITKDYDKNIVTICNMENISNVSSHYFFESDDNDKANFEPNHFKDKIIQYSTKTDAETNNDLNEPQEITGNISSETFYEVDQDDNMNGTYTITKNSLECVHICKNTKKLEEPLQNNVLSPADSYETIVKPDLSEVDDKSTQVFCQMQKEENFEEITAEYTPTVSNDETICEKIINLPKTKEDSEDDSDNMNYSKSSENESFAGTQINIFYDHSDENIVPKVTEKTLTKVYNGIYGEEAILKVKKSLHNMKQPKIVVFREVPEVTNLLRPLKDIEKFADTKTYHKRLEKKRQLKLIKKASVELIKKKNPTNIPADEENVILLKSFYAIVYILMFTALSLDYKCI